MQDLKTRIQATKRSFRTRYAVLKSQPDLSTLVIRVKREGQSQWETLTRLEDNTSGSGYVYRGHGTAPQFDLPVVMHSVTGYLVELVGAAALVGEDQLDIQYQVTGVRNSAN